MLYDFILVAWYPRFSMIEICNMPIQKQISFSLLKNSPQLNRWFISPSDDPVANKKSCYIIKIIMLHIYVIHVCAYILRKFHTCIHFVNTRQIKLEKKKKCFSIEIHVWNLFLPVMLLLTCCVKFILFSLKYNYSKNANSFIFGIKLRWNCKRIDYLSK